MFGGEGNTLGLAGFDRKRIEPERLPAVIQTVQQPEMMTVQMEHRRHIAPVGQGEDDRSAAHGAEGRRGCGLEVCWQEPSGLNSSEREIGPQCAGKVELGRQLV